MTTPTNTNTNMPITTAPFPIGPSALALVAVLALFAGGRILEDGSANVAMGAAVVLSLVAAAWRLQRAAGSTGPGAKTLVGRAVAAHTAVAVGAGALLASALLKLTDDAANIATTVGLVLSVGGSAVLWALELLMAQTRATGLVDAPRVQRATQTAVTLVAGLSALVAVVFALQKSDARLELAFASPTSPSGATASVIDTAVCGDDKQKPEVFLFFERGSTALGEVADYFDGLKARGARVQTLDQALDPALSKALKVTKNGTVAVRCGEKTDTIPIGADRDEAQRKVKKLDQDVRTKLGKLTRDPVTVYFTVGHGERSLDGSDKTGRAGGKSMKKLLDANNATTKKLGIADGLTDKVPDDAGLVVVFGPDRAFLPEEAAALSAYVARGGALAIFVDPARPGTDDVDVGLSLQPVMQTLGLKVTPGEVVNDKEFVKQSNTSADHVFVFSTSFGTHKAVKTLNGARGKAALLFLSAQALSKAEAATSPKVSLVARSRPASFVDLNGNRAFDDAAEKREIVDLAAVVEVKADGDKEGRAVVVGDSDVVADTLLANEANAVFAYEALQWLLRDDASVADGATVVDDAPIRHTRDEDTLWFYGTTLGGPALVIALGALVVRLRRRRPAAPRAAASVDGGAA